MPTRDALRAFASQLPDVEERRASSGTAAELVTNAKCFVSMPDHHERSADVVTSREGLAALTSRPDGAFAAAEGVRGNWVRVRLSKVSSGDLERVVLEGWKLRSQKRSQYAYLGPRFFADIDPILSELRSWPELTETSTGHFYVNRKPFMHFHYGWTERHSDVKTGAEWGPPIPISLGEPSAAEVRSFLAEVRRRLALATGLAS